ncbi:hypothetical protein B0H14DRAFT_3473020 [Mycena olivaceomarginata]|nr:hypothetical protein B0H14DRAFT_3473020 [Mycena olivaceomarginata]
MSFPSPPISTTPSSFQRLAGRPKTLSKVSVSVVPILPGAVSVVVPICVPLPLGRGAPPRVPIRQSLASASLGGPTLPTASAISVSVPVTIPVPVIDNIRPVCCRALHTMCTNNAEWYKRACQGLVADEQAFQAELAGRTGETDSESEQA